MGTWGACFAIFAYTELTVVLEANNEKIRGKALNLS
jgi:hypothetical protein